MTAATTSPAATGAPPGAADLAVQVRGLSHTYKPTRQRRSSRRHAPPPQDAALSRVDLDVRSGEIFALGPNGSGKSTLLRILATVQAARQTEGEPGRATIFGHDLATRAPLVRQQLGVVFQQPALDLKLTAFENLRTHGKLYGMSGQSLDAAARLALESLGLGGRMDDRTESFSGGMRRRVEIAKALLTKPRLLLMDEASAGLDLAIQREIWADLRQLVADHGLTVLLTTHLMHEAELADRVAVMSRGGVIAVDTPSALVAKVGGNVLEITPASGVLADRLLASVLDMLGSRLSADDTAVVDGRVLIEHAQAASMIEPIAERLGDDAASLRLGRPTLADAYLKLTGQTLSA